MLKKYLTVFFVSMVPLIELRGAIPYGVIFGAVHLFVCAQDPGMGR